MTTLAIDDFRSPAGFLALQSLPRVGPVKALKATLRAAELDVLMERHHRHLKEALERAQGRMDEYQQAGVDLLTFFDKRYPERLRELPDPPPLLYVRGNPDVLLQDRLVAVVGTREPTRFGTSAAQSLTAALAGGGWGIVSGLAKGIDTIAHRVALEHGAPTVAVLGGGLDGVYPAENKGLAARILDDGGTLLSEQPFGVPPRPQHLIARDRIQSALSVAVLVAQSGVKSGTMHTARFAAAQGRPLFCPVPRNENGASEGLRLLLERPANELCSALPAWRQAQALCARLGERPLANPVSRDDLPGFLQAVELAFAHPKHGHDQQMLIAPFGLDEAGHISGTGSL